MATVLSFIRPGRPERIGWSNEDRAQFARIQRVLLDAGLDVEIEEGLTDEDEPWCVLCSGLTGEVVVHIARIDGTYLLDSPVLPDSIEGRDLDHCARRFTDDATVLVPRTRQGTTVTMHPSSMLAAIILTIFLYVEALGDRVPAAAATVEETPGAEAEAAPDAAPEGEGDASAKADPDAASGDGGPDAEKDKALILLRQEIAEIAQKGETERSSWGIQGLNQTWIAALPTGAFAAVMVHAWAVLHALSDEKTDMVATADRGTTEENGDARKGLSVEAETGDGTGTAQGVEIEAASGGAPAGRPVETVDAFLFTGSVLPAKALDAALVSAPRDIAIPDDPAPRGGFVFAPPVAAFETEGNGRAVEADPADPIPVDFLSDMERLVAFFSAGETDFLSAFTVSDGFVEIAPSSAPVTGGEGVPAAAAPVVEAPVAVLPVAPAPVSQVAVPVVAPPAERESFVYRDAADLITAFVELTGRVLYELEDGNLILQDASVVGWEAESDTEIATRRVELADSEIVFVGFSDELDIVFA